MLKVGTRIRYTGDVTAWKGYTGIVVKQEPWMAEYVDAGGNPIQFDMIDMDNVRFFKEDDLAVLESGEYTLVSNGEPSLEDYPPDPEVLWATEEEKATEFPLGFEWSEEEERPVFVDWKREVAVVNVDERHPDSQRFHDWLEGAGRLHDMKQQDYGTGEDPFANIRRCERYDIPAWVGCAIRMADKMARIEKAVGQWARGESIHMSNEALIDSFNDLGVYSGIGVILLEDFQRGA